METSAGYASKERQSVRREEDAKGLVPDRSKDANEKAGTDSTDDKAVGTGMRTEAKTYIPSPLEGFRTNAAAAVAAAAAAAATATAADDAAAANDGGGVHAAVYRDGAPTHSLGPMRSGGGRGGASSWAAGRAARISAGSLQVKLALLSSFLTFPCLLVHRLSASPKYYTASMARAFDLMGNEPSTLHAQPSTLNSPPPALDPQL